MKHSERGRKGKTHKRPRPSLKHDIVSWVCRVPSCMLSECVRRGTIVGMDLLVVAGVVAAAAGAADAAADVCDYGGNQKTM